MKNVLEPLSWSSWRQNKILEDYYRGVNVHRNFWFNSCHLYVFQSANVHFRYKIPCLKCRKFQIPNTCLWIGMDRVLPVALSSGQRFQFNNRLDFKISKLISDALLSLWSLRWFRHSCNLFHYWIFGIAFFLNLVAVPTIFWTRFSI